VLGIALLAFGFLAGVAIVATAAPGMDAELTWIAGPALGLVSATWLVYLAGLAGGGLSTASIGGAVAALALASSPLLVRSRRAAVRPPRWLAALGLAFAGLFLAIGLTGILSPGPGGRVYAFEHIWADLPFHTALVTSFAYRAQVPPVHPLAAGSPLDYPFLVDFLSAALLRGGLSLRAAMVAEGVMLQTLAFAGIAVLAKRLTRSVGAGVLSSVVVLLLGNLGLLAIPADIVRSHGPVRWLSDLPWSYTGDALGNKGRARIGMGVYLGNPTFMFVVPRRAGAFGLATGLPVLALAQELLRSPGFRVAVIGGLLAGLTVRVHAHTTIVLGLVVLVWLIAAAAPGLRARPKNPRVESWGPWAVMCAVAAALAVPQLTGPLAHMRRGFFVLGWLGWTGEPHAALSDLLSSLTLPALMRAAGVSVWFWVLNAGLLGVLLIPALLLASARSRVFYAGFGAVWLLANLVRAQPSPWDNSAFFVYWQIGSGIVVCELLWRWWGAGARSAAAARACLALLCAGGLLSLAYVAEHPMALWSRGEMRLASDIRMSTPRTALILTAGGESHNHPVDALTGRSVYKGWSGWLWAHGLDWIGYEDRVRQMYTGDAELVRRSGIDYVVLGPYERRWASDEDIEISAVFEDRDLFRPVLERRLDGEDWELVAVVR
jgi:hypothetical protein